ncbi:MAG: serine/threonine protein kinase [Proteobacteria bacterium]|nr:serine/threonine protein kinase [Pseudomonadota bacterium]
MDKSGNTSNPSGLTSNRMANENANGMGSRPLIHSALSAGSENSAVGLPKSRVSLGSKRLPTITPPGGVSGAKPSSPSIVPSAEPVASDPSPGVMPASELPVDDDNHETQAIVRDGAVPPTQALGADELAAAGLPQDQDGGVQEAEVEAPMTTLPVGMKIDDRYEILDTLGVGGFATVYKARHLTIDRDVALKVMDLKKGVDPSYSQRFFREAKIAAKIHHNNVVSIYDFGHVSETGQPYIAMEMLHGHDLSHELKVAGPLSPKRMYVLFRPVLEALGQGHGLGIVHKDLKPENLYLVDPRGQHELMKVLDFGVARINSNEVAKLTSAGQLLGTPRYLAPEYIKQQIVSPAIDVYQMALIISEALTGIPAVSGDPYHAMMLHCSGKLQIAEFLLDGPVGEVFRKAISIDPDKRYADCNAFAAALDSIAEYFESEVPLEGGAPQITPESATAAGLNTLLSSRQNTGEENSENNNNSNEEVFIPPKKSNVPVIVGAIIFIGLALIIAIVFIVKLKKAQENPDVVVVQQPTPVEIKDPEYKFKFISDPPGAEVKLNGIVQICDSTPCEKVYKKSELGMPQTVHFILDGYDSTFQTICIAGMNDTGCVFKHGEKEDEVLDVEVELAKSKPTEVKILITYTPPDSTVKNRHGVVVCKATPCEFELTQADGYEELSISNKNTKLTAPPQRIVFEDALDAVLKDNLDGYKIHFAMTERKPKQNTNQESTSKVVYVDRVVKVKDDSPKPPQPPQPPPKPVPQF